MLLSTAGASAQSKSDEAKAKAIPCPQSARHLDGDPGDRQVVVCPAHCRGPLVWGTDVYADDSSICAAARHAGAYDGTTSQRIVVEFLPGQAGYQGSERHGITSHHWGMWPRSFAVYSLEEAANNRSREQAQPMSAQAQPLAHTDAPAQVQPQSRALSADSGSQPGTGDTEDVFAQYASEASDDSPRYQTVDCSLRGDELSEDLGSKHVVRCPSGCNDESIWGSGPYNADSSVCASAIHAGAIPPDKGGLVRVTIRGEAHDAKSSTAHGVKSEAWSYWPRSFDVEPAQ